jgi:hypothetical protein
MAEREMAKLRSKKPRNEPSSSSSQKKDQFRPSQKEFDDLVKAMPDPANVQDSLLADDGACVFFSSSKICCCWSSLLVLIVRVSQVNWNFCSFFAVTTLRNYTLLLLLDLGSFWSLGACAI